MHLRSISNRSPVESIDSHAVLIIETEAKKIEFSAYVRFEINKTYQHVNFKPIIKYYYEIIIYSSKSHISIYINIYLFAKKSFTLEFLFSNFEEIKFSQKINKHRIIVFFPPLLPFSLLRFSISEPRLLDYFLHPCSNAG